MGYWFYIQECQGCYTKWTAHFSSVDMSSSVKKECPECGVTDIKTEEYNPTDGI